MIYHYVVTAERGSSRIIWTEFINSDRPDLPGINKRLLNAADELPGWTIFSRCVTKQRGEDVWNDGWNFKHWLTYAPEDYTGKF